MTLTERFLSGFALAATIAKDPGGAEAEAGLCSHLAAPTTALARELLKLSKAERRARVRAWLEHSVPAPSTLPLQRTRAMGASRTGRVPDPRLLALLARISAQHAPHTPESRQASKPWDE